MRDVVRAVLASGQGADAAPFRADDAEVVTSFPVRLRQLAEAAGGRAALSCGGVETTYGELWRQVERATV